jgi:hypothetical protein
MSHLQEDLQENRRSALADWERTHGTTNLRDTCWQK